MDNTANDSSRSPNCLGARRIDMTAMSTSKSSSRQLGRFSFSGSELGSDIVGDRSRGSAGAAGDCDLDCPIGPGSSAPAAQFLNLPLSVNQFRLITSDPRHVDKEIQRMAKEKSIHVFNLPKFKRYPPTQSQ
jgi:hypothetical protein